MQAITGINHIGIRVKSLDVARAFYAQLGFEFIMGPVGPEPVAMVKHPCGVELNFILNADQNSHSNILMDVAEKHPGYTHMALEVNDIKKVEQELGRLNIAITEKMTMPNGAAMVFIRDPDGNVIELHQPA